MSMRSRSVRLVVLLGVLLPLLAAAATAATAAPTPKYTAYFGDLHAHTSYSDGVAGYTPWDAFAMGAASGADFMALTEHYSATNTYENWTMDEAEWADLKAAAAFYTSSDFVAIPAYEFYLAAHSGEFNTFNVSDLPPKMEITGPERLGLYYDWLAQQPGGVGQFNHPTYVTDEFNDFIGRNAARDVNMAMIEVYNDELYEESWIKVLDAGWHVMPTANSDTHKADWMVRDMRTVLLAEKLTAASLCEAMRAQRGYATLDKNLCVDFTVNGRLMGSTLSGTASAYTASVKISDPDALAGNAADAVTLVEIVSDGGAVVKSLTPSATAGVKGITWTAKGLPSDAGYFWVRVSTASDDANGVAGVTAWTAPVWTGR